MDTQAIDAAWEAEPIATAMNTQNLARSVAITGELVPGTVAGALAVSPQFLRTQAEAAQRFVNAFLRGARDYYTEMQVNDHGPVIQTLIKHTTIKDPSLHAQIGLPSYDPNCSTDPTPSWAAFPDFYVKRGMQGHSADPVCRLLAHRPRSGPYGPGVAWRYDLRASVCSASACRTALAGSGSTMTSR